MTVIFNGGDLSAGRDGLAWKHARCWVLGSTASEPRTYLRSDEMRVTHLAMHQMSRGQYYKSQFVRGRILYRDLNDGSYEIWSHSLYDKRRRSYDRVSWWYLYGRSLWWSPDIYVQVGWGMALTITLLILRRPIVLRPSGFTFFWVFPASFFFQVIVLPHFVDEADEVDRHRRPRDS